MKRFGVSARWAVVCLDCAVMLAGCGGGGGSSSGGGGGQSTPPSIASFTAASGEILAGGSTTLTAVFSNGTGVITPGNLTVTSGTAVSVTPSATTTYTLTVSGSGSPATQTLTVKVDPLPVISSFSASPNPITAGSSTSLTAVFSGGTGVITPGNLVMVSGAPLSVSPTTTTTYTLTVTPAMGSAITQTTTVTVNPAVAISNFYANPTTIKGGTSANLYPYFTGGSGVITPGNLAVSSGTAVSVSPTVTTTYTLTVTPTAGGTPVTKTATLTVYSITSFTASANPIVTGSSTQLTAVFAGGTGAITGPGGFSTPAASGVAVSVSPAVTATYTLTVTPVSGSPITQTATVTVEPTVTVDLSSVGPAISDHLLGMNLAMWYDVISNASPILNAFKTAGITALRWPGGSNSDIYHWNGSAVYPTIAAPTNCNGGYSVPGDTFSNFVNDIVTPGGFDLAVTANYGSNASCNGPGQPSEAAGWAAAAVADGSPIHYMTVGNESYGNWEYDLHTPAANQHNASVYASEIIGSSGYHDLIKAQSSNTLVGVVVDGDGASNGWDATVLGTAKGSYDFVEFHYYPQYSPPSVTSDTFLVQQAAPEFTTNINTIKQELATAGASGTPIYVGELGSNSANPGTQSWSITQGLYAGQILGEAMNDGVARLTWWLGFGNCLRSANVGGANPYNNNNASLYGWQNTWGAFNVFSDVDPNCPGEGAIGTMSPTAQAFNLFQNVAVTGETALTATVEGDTTNVRAYAATHSGGTALVLFNLNETAAESVVVTLAGQSSSSKVQVMTYDKQMYDYTNTNCALDPSCSYDATHDYSNPQWVGPSTTTLTGPQTLPLTLTLQPWSMNVVLVQ